MCVCSFSIGVSFIGQEICLFVCFFCGGRSRIKCYLTCVWSEHLYWVVGLCGYWVYFTKFWGV